MAHLLNGILCTHYAKSDVKTPRGMANSNF